MAYRGLNRFLRDICDKAYSEQELDINTWNISMRVNIPGQIPLISVLYYALSRKRAEQKCLELISGNKFSSISFELTPCIEMFEDKPVINSGNVIRILEDPTESKGFIQYSQALYSLFQADTSIISLQSAIKDKRHEVKKNSDTLRISPYTLDSIKLYIMKKLNFSHNNVLAKEFNTWYEQQQTVYSSSSSSHSDQMSGVILRTESRTDPRSVKSPVRVSSPVCKRPQSPTVSLVKPPVKYMDKAPNNKVRIVTSRTESEEDTHDTVSEDDK